MILTDPNINFLIDSKIILPKDADECSTVMLGFYPDFDTKSNYYACYIQNKSVYIKTHSTMAGIGIFVVIEYTKTTDEGGTQ